MTHTRQVCSAIVGGAAALGAWELVLRLLASPTLPPRPHIARDRLDAPAVTYRQLDEGVAITHFSAEGARLTGNAPVDGAPTVVILGDSYVDARQVPDGETMGAVFERIARENGRPINVRQYGWRSTSPAQYLLVAPKVLARWHPARVIIPLSALDLDEIALTDASPHLSVTDAGRLSVIGPPDSISPPRNESSLATLARRRWQALKLRERASEEPLPWLSRTKSVPVAVSFTARPDSAELAVLPRAVVHALSRAFGSRLSLIYLAKVGLVGGDSTTVIERRLLDACGAEGVQCVSTRTAMLEQRQQGVIARGFATTTIGSGHLNAAGHRLVADAMWGMFAQDSGGSRSLGIGPGGR